MGEKSMLKKAPAKRAARKTASIKSWGQSPSLEVTAEEKHRLIAEEAYYRAERRGFVGGSEIEDWQEAELEIERRLSTKAQVRRN